MIAATRYATNKRSSSNVLPHPSRDGALMISTKALLINFAFIIILFDSMKNLLIVFKKFK